MDDVFGEILEELLGPLRVEQTTPLRTVAPTCPVLHPSPLDQGGQIARDLGLTSALDHRLSPPGETIWSGDYLGVEVQVRASLRTPVGSNR